MPSAQGIDCQDPKYNKYLPLAICFLIIFVIAAPLLLLVFLYRHRQLVRDREPVFTVRFGVLFEAVSPTAYWFEPFALMRRAAFVAVDAVLFSSNDTRCYLLMVLALLCFLLHLRVQPYASMLPNQMEGYLLMLVSLLASAMIGADPAKGIRPDAAMDIWIAIAVLVPLIVCTVLVVRDRVQHRLKNIKPSNKIVPTTDSPLKATLVHVNRVSHVSVELGAAQSMASDEPGHNTQDK